MAGLAFNCLPPRRPVPHSRSDWLRIPSDVSQQLDQPGHYKGYAEWESLEAIEEFRLRPDFPEMLQAMRDHLEDFAIFTGRRIVGSGS
jgi:quinol monooxygenase YgiN